jgi:peptidoglycan/xylan/chitin deacetylase (PgdA/CDA1 family)
MRRTTLCLFLALVLSSTAALTSGEADALAPGALPRRVAPFVVSRVPTKDPVVFVTIDDGFHRTAGTEALIDKYRWPVTSFVLPKTLGGTKTTWFESLGPQSVFGNHTITHRNLRGLSLKTQQREICGATKKLDALVGPHTSYFRPPFGSYDETTIKAARACGMTHLVMWRATLYGRDLRTWGGPVRAGDVILLHYIQSLPESLRYLKSELARLNLRVASLPEYLGDAE